jgi:putative transposase
VIRTIHQWLLVTLYCFATWLRHRATIWQKLLRHSLLPYAVRHYHPTWPETAKPVKHWEERLAEAQKAGNPISPVNHRRPIPDDLHCPSCGAPRDYIYNFGYEHGHSGDEAFHKILCKICGFQTAPERPKREPKFRCPYCGRALEKVKERKDFDVYKCRSKRCSYRHNANLRAEAVKAGANPKAISYIRRDFHLSLDELQLQLPHKPKVDFAQIRHTTACVALAVTFHIHMGLSLRETAYWLRQLYGLPVSHQTVANWTQSVAFLLAPMTCVTSDAQILSGDETYIDIAGEDAYWNASYDPENAQVVVHHVSLKRDTEAATKLIKATADSAPNMKAFVSDDWAPYALALTFLGEQLPHVPGHIVVKGLKSRGVPEDAFLFYKDMLERFFRTFKQRYRRTLGFSNYNGAVTFCILFVVYYNYFRPHMRLDGETPVSLLGSQNVLQKWQQLIQKALKAA